MDFVRTIASDDEEEGANSEGSINGEVEHDFFSGLGEAVKEEEEKGAKEWDFQADGRLERIDHGTTLADKIRHRQKEREEDNKENEKKNKKKNKNKNKRNNKNEDNDKDDENNDEEESDSNDDALEQAFEKKRQRAEEVKQAKETSAPKRIKGTPSHLKTDVHFSDLHLSKPLLKALQDLGFDAATPIQRDVIPHALQGSDVLGTAETGSGKTGAFVLPTLERIHSSPSLRGRYRTKDGRVITGKVSTKALILLPTRELAAQCYSMMSDLMKYTYITASLICGGYQSQAQASNLRSQPDIVVCTPGRLLDHLLNTQNVHLELLEVVILDEADRLLELGFRDECQQIIRRCSKGRQTMLFSATLNPDVQDLATLALQKPIRITTNAPNKVVKTLHQEFIRLKSEESRSATLLALIRRRMEEKKDATENVENLTIVFFSRKKDAHFMATIFGLAGIPSAELHGNLSQSQRIEGVTKFQKGEVQILLATDLASRGLDLYGVGTVINHEVPNESAKYIHRVGRTARMGNEGESITLFTDEEYNQVKKLGKLCSAEMKAEIVKRTMASAVVEAAEADIKKWQPDVDAIVEEEILEREMRLADIQAKKADNMVAHKSEIYRRPQKQWTMSTKEKHDLQEQEKLDKEEKRKKTEPKKPSAIIPGESEKDYQARLRKEKWESQESVRLKDRRVKHDAHMRALGQKGKKKMAKNGGKVVVKKKGKNKKKFNAGSGDGELTQTTGPKEPKSKRNKKGGKKGGKPKRR